MNNKKGKVCVGGIGPTPLAYDLEDLEGASVKELAQKARQEAKSVSNTTLSPAYRKKMVDVLTQRAIKRALKEGK